MSIESSNGWEGTWTALLLLGTLTSAEPGEPISFYPIQLYHADAKGSYGDSPSASEAQVRIRGTVQTDSLGRFLVSSILPAGNGSGNQIFGSGHIHTAVEGATREAQDFFGQGSGHGLLRYANSAEQAVVLDFRLAPGDTLLATGTLVVRGFTEAANIG